MPALDLGPIRFAAALWLLGVLVLVPAAWALALDARRRAEADRAYGGSRLLRRGASPSRRWIRSTLLLLAILALALASARPQWGREEQPVQRRGIDVAIVLDVSRSMTADDVEPTRAQAAATNLNAMLTHLRGDRAGLIIFGGTAFERSPLTTDLEALGQLISRAQGESTLVRPGSNLAVAIETALNLLTVDDAAETQALVLVSDGEDEGGEALRFALDRARDKGVRIYTVLAGTEAGGQLTDDPTLNEVSRADATRMREIAQASGGDLRDLASAPGLAVEFRRLGRTLFEEETEEAMIDRFQWFLAAGLALLVLHAVLSGGARGPRRRRRRLAAPGVAVAAALLLAACAGTAVYRHVDAGNQAYERGRYEEALASYRAAAELEPEEPAVLYNSATALHQLRRYEESAVSAEEALRFTRDPELASKIEYTQGGNAFRRGLLEEARTAYMNVLRREPADVDAKANLELVLRALEPPPQQQPGNEEQPGQQGENGDGQGEPGDGQQPGQPGQDGDGQGQPQPGDGSPTPGQPGDGTDGGGDSAEALNAARAALMEALAELGEEVTAEEALRILELARRANSLESLIPRGQPGPVPAR
jgi:Ca-activated chloride channel family protein